MKLATYNVNGINARLPNLIEWLERAAPDIVCLQELKSTDAAFPKMEIRAAGYGAIWHGQSAWNGVAILARDEEPIETRRGLPGDNKDSHSRYIEARAGGLIVGCLYLPNGNPQPGPKFDYKLAWFERLITYAAKLYKTPQPVVLAGDYNVIPSDEDIYNTRSWLKDALLQPESRACFERLMAQGWMDALRAQHPDERIYTFWDYFRRHWQTNSGLRIDHILLNASLAPRLHDAGVDRWVRGQPHASDHAPTWIEIADSAGRARKSKLPKMAASKTVRDISATAIPAKPRSVPGVRAAMTGGAFKPELCKPQDITPTGENWLHEIKWDGYRMVSSVENGEVHLWSRNAIEWTKELPEIVEALRSLKLKSAQLDGELVVLKDGQADFNLLKARLSGDNTAPLLYVLFDIPYLNGRKLSGVPLLERKLALEQLLRGNPHPALRYSQHVVGGGAAAFAQASENGLEGVISKRVDSPYREGRAGDWIKTKTRASDEFVVVGFTAPKGSRSSLGSLLLGREEGGQLRYAGRCGTGFDEAMLRQLHKALKPLIVDEPAVNAEALEPRVRKTVLWVKPRMIVEVFYMGLGGQGLLRHPAFKAIREDKNLDEIMGSKPKAVVNSAKMTQPQSAKRNVDFGDTVVLTHPDRLVYKDAAIDKQAVADYYRAVMPRFLPAIVNRPMSVVRCPDGVGGQAFFQKHVGRGWGRHILAAEADRAGEAEPYLYIREAAGVIELVQMNVIEFHPWASTVENIEHADYVVFDLDPDASVSWKRVVKAALDLRELLEGVHLQSFVRTTGGKGLHVVVPLSPPAPWEQAKDFAHSLASTLAQHRPEEFVDVANKSKRTGRIFIDWLRNGRGATSVASYSLRARPGAKVAMPLSWEELPKLKSGIQYDLHSTLRRLKASPADPWKDFEAVKQSLDQLQKQRSK